LDPENRGGLGEGEKSVLGTVSGVEKRLAGDREGKYKNAFF